MEKIQTDLDTEDIKIEDEALKETTNEDLKKEIIEKYGFNEEDNEELIEKLLEDKLEERKKLGTAIKQKRNWREKFNTIKPEEKEIKKEIKEENKDSKISLSQTEIDALVEKRLNEKFDEKEIDSADLSDELKKEAKNYAKVNEVTIKEALKSDYIQYKIEKEKDKVEIDDASISNKHDKTKSNKNFKDMKISDFDVSTPEGRKEWSDYKKTL